MAFHLNGLVDIKASPDTDAPLLDSIMGKTVFGTGKTFKDDAGADWINILIPPALLVDGWVSAASCTEVPDPSPEPLDPEMFVRQCTLVDRRLNADPSIAPNCVTADFIIARAIFETGLTQKVFAPAAIDGALRLLQKEWNDFVGSGLDAAVTFSPSNGIYPLAQVYAAGYRMHLDGLAMSRSLAGTAGDDPFVPSYLDLFHCYLSSPDGAVALRRDETNQGQALSAILASNDIAAMATRPALSRVTGTMSVPEFFALTEPVLGSLLNNAFAKIQHFAGDELPKDPGGSAPWLDVAKTQLGKTAKKDAKEVRGYFAATDFGALPGGTVPAWCGAFAAFCMSKAGLDAEIPKGAALASNWRKWGTSDIPLASNSVPAGAVVVLTEIQTKTGPHGHVGFFDGFSTDGRSVFLIGGNQSGSVSRTSFPVTRIAAVRWRQTQEDSAGAAGKYKLAAVGVRPELRQWGDLIVDRFTRAGLGKDQHLRTALANAIRESGLDPKTSNITAREESYGLFQCNRKGGLGSEHQPEQLMTPDINVSIIIKAARASHDFVAASTLEGAMLAFVRDVERPRDPTKEAANRLATAKKL